MKKLTIASCILLLAIAGYTFWWHQVASAAEEQAVSMINAFNEDASHPFLLEYSSLSKAGYPFDVALSLSNPTLSLKKKQPNNVSVLLEGEASLSRSLWGSAFWVKSRGKTTLKAERLFQLVTEGKTEASFVGAIEELLKEWMNRSLTAAKIADLLSWHSAAADWRSFDLAVYSSAHSPNSSTAEPFHLIADKSIWSLQRSELEKGKEKVEKEKIEAQFKFDDISFKGDLKKEKTVLQEEAEASFLQQMSQLFFSPSDYDHMKIEGKGRVSYLFSDLPNKIFLAPLPGKSSGLDLEIDHLSVATDLISHRLERFLFSLFQEEMEYKLAYKLGDQQTLYTAKYDEVLQRRLEAFWSNPSNLSSLFDGDEEIVKQVASHSLALATAMNPALGKWGPIKSNSDFSLHAELLPKLQANCQLKAFAFSVAEFSFNLFGQADLVNQQGSLTSKTTHYVKLIDLLAQSINRVLKAVEELKLENLPLLPHIDPEDINDFNAFLKSISDAGSSEENLSITVSFDGSNGVYIADKTVDQVGDLWQEMVMNILQRKQGQLLAFEGLSDEEAHQEPIDGQEV